MTKLLAYHNDPAIKAEYLARVKAHAEADEIKHGFYWEGGKGCAVGCTIHGADHVRYETELGIPRILARLEDRIFEGLSNGNAKDFPARFLSAITPGADLSKVWPKFAVWLLVDPKHGIARFTKKDSAQYIAIHRVADLYRDLKDWDERDKAAFKKAAAAAYAAAAADAAAADAAAAYAAVAAAYAAYAADAAAYAAARSTTFKLQAEKLLELLGEAQ